MLLLIELRKGKSEDVELKKKSNNYFLNFLSLKVWYTREMVNREEGRALVEITVGNKVDGSSPLRFRSLLPPKKFLIYLATTFNREKAAGFYLKPLARTERSFHSNSDRPSCFRGEAYASMRYDLDLVVLEKTVCPHRRIFPSKSLASSSREQ